MVNCELDFLTEVFTQNGYPIQFIKRNLELRAKAPKTCTVEKKRLYISLPFKGVRVAQLISRRLNSAVRDTYNAAIWRIYLKRLLFVMMPVIDASVTNAS